MYSERLTELRQVENVKHQSLADLLGIQRSGYSHYENEDYIIPLKYLIKLCDYFNVSLDYMLGFTNMKRYKEYQLIEPDSKLAGLRIKEFRKKLNITQKVLAIDLETTQSVIAGYESGRYLISTKNLYSLCEIYHVSADYILGRINSMEIIQHKSTNR